MSSIDLQKEQSMAKHREDIIQLVQSGDSYTAIEKALVYVRQMKKLNELEDALIFMMRIALILLDRGDWHSASVCAYRSMLQFPSDSKTIRKVLKQLFFDFAERTRPESVCPELFGFYRKLISLFHDREEELLIKEASLADQANHYYYAQTFYSELLIKYLHPSSENETEEQRNKKIDKVISSLSILIWRWIQSQDQEGKQHQINISQYIFARCTLLILTIHNQNIIEIVQKFVSVFKSSLPSSFEAAAIFNLPLFHFIDFFIKALDRKSKKTVDFLIKKYEPALKADSDLLEYANTAKDALNSRDTSGLAGLGSMLQSFLGRMLGGNDNENNNH